LKSVWPKLELLELVQNDLTFLSFMDKDFYFNFAAEAALPDNINHGWLK
jgi:hypothetical protein